MSPDQPPLRKGRKPLLNMFALPQQTTILAVLIILVIYAVLLAISTGTPPVTFWPLLMITLILSIRSLIAWPEQEFHKYHLVPAGEQFAPLETRIQELCQQLKLKPVPCLVITPKDADIATFGSWRRWYIVAGDSYATALLNSLQNPATAADAEAVLLHELHHFQHGDNIRIGYNRALLQTSVMVMLWAMLFLVGLISFLILVKDFVLTTSPADVVTQFEDAMHTSGIPRVDLPPDLLMSEADWQELRTQAAETDYGLVMLYAVTNTLSIFLIGLFFASVIWYKLLRIREYYADAKVAHIQRTITPIIRALITINPRRSKEISIVRRGKQALANAVKSLPTAYFFRLHPSPNERFARLKNPATIYDPWWKLALFIGVYISFLWLLLTNTSLSYVATWPLHFPVLTAFILISLALIVRHVQGIDVRYESLNIVGITLIPHMLLLFVVLSILWIGLLFAPTLLAGFLNDAVSVVAGYAGTVQEDLFSADLRSFVIQTSIVNIIQIPVMLCIIYLFVRIQSMLTQRILTWYSFPNAEQHLMKVIYGSITLLVVVLACGVLPIISSVILPSSFVNFLSPLFWVSIGASTILAILGGVWFRQQDRRYARKCSCCGTTIATPSYVAGDVCSACNGVLHPWLLANYETEVER